MPYFSKKGVYHSWLQKKSPIVLQFTSDVIDSKFKGQSDFIWFRVRGDDDPEETYYYLIENDKIREMLEGVDQTIWYKVMFQSEEIAEGEFNAWIELEPLGDAGAPPSGGGSSNSKASAGKYDVPPTVDLVGKLTECLWAASKILRDQETSPYDLNDVSPDAMLESVRATANTLFIAWQNRGFAGALTGSDPVPLPEEPETQSGTGTIESDLMAQLDRIERRTGKSHDGKDLGPALAAIEKMVKAGNVEIDKYMNAALWLRKEAEHQQKATVPSEDDFDDELPF